MSPEGRKTFTVDAGTTGQLGGWTAGVGAPVLVLHGGPGLSFSYLEGLVGDIGSGYEVDLPATRPGPVVDKLSCRRSPISGRRAPGAGPPRVASGLGHWPLMGRAFAVHFAVAHQHRLMGGLAVDPLGAVGDGGLAGFVTEMRNRATEEAVAQIDELDRLSGDGQPDDRVMRQHLALIWPGYFADPARGAGYARHFCERGGLWHPVRVYKEELPGLEASLGTVKVPIGFLAGSESPLPIDDQPG